MRAGPSPRRPSRLGIATARFIAGGELVGCCQEIADRYPAVIASDLQMERQPVLAAGDLDRDGLRSIAGRVGEGHDARPSRLWKTVIQPGMASRAYRSLPKAS